MTQFNLLAQAAGRLIDRFNDRFTSYRLMLYYLLALVGWAAVGGIFNKVPYHWYQILFSAGWLVGICWAANKLLARLLDIPANKESGLITGLILALILSPASDSHSLALISAAGLAAIASKFVITVYKSHIFNPAAAGAFVIGEFFHKYPSWWVGTKFMAPVIVIGGILVMRKMKRFTMVSTFFAVYLLYLIFGTSGGGNLHFLWSALISTQVLFFGYVMLTEPQTSPTAIQKYLPYTLLVGILYSATKLKISPEAALLIGNLLAFIIAPKRRYSVEFIRKVREADGIYSYAFKKPPKLSFRAGQYMEWTMPGSQTDSRGNRRYLTVSSSPTEDELMITVKLPTDQPSAFKRRLDELEPGQTILASYLAGSFSLPADSSKKLAFLAGGVGITPFRSIIKYLADSGQKRDAALLYSAAAPSQIAFSGLFKQARPVGLKTGYLTDRRVDRPTIAAFVPDYAERTFYVSGPIGFVKNAETALIKMGLPPSRIITDYFPGYGN